MMENTELINKLRILRGAILNPHHRTGEYVDKRFADVVSDAADALEAADKRTAELMPKEGEWEWLSSTYDRVPREMRYWCSVCHHEEITHDDKPWKHYCPNCGAKMKGEQE